MATVDEMYYNVKGIEEHPRILSSSLRANAIKAIIIKCLIPIQIRKR